MKKFLLLTSVMMMLCGALTAQTPFVCGGTVPDYDGYNYQTVSVAGYCWMKENLRSTHYAGGLDIPSATVYHYGNLDDQAANLATYGRLYTWYSAVNVPENSTLAPSVDAEGYVRGACPAGWHIPTVEEMDALRALSADDLRSLNLWLNGENNTNSTGFTALPAGQYTSATSRYEYLLGRTGFWSVDGSALMSSTLNTTMIMNYCDVPLTSPMMKADALSVRCVLGGEAATAEAPTLGATTLVGAVTLSSATISSEVLADGGALVTERGFCWSTASNPTVSGSHVSSGSGLGEFTSSLSGLLPNTTYHVRSYAVNSEGVAYGPETTFTTTCGTVNVTISGATSVCAGSSVTLSANGATTYSWNTNPATTSSSTTVSPTATTTYTVEGTDQYGCTGTATHTVTVYNGTFTTVTESACNGYEWYGVNYTESGSYPHEYTNGYGCPSTETLQLTIYKPTHTAVSVSECDSYTWNGTTYTMSGDYIYPHPDEHGCTQVDTLHLTINKPTHTASTVEECDSYTWNGTTYTMSGDYIYPHPDEHGCTQVDTLHLTLTPCAVPPTVTTGGATDIAEHTATLNATITNPDNVTVTAKGFEYRASGGYDYSTDYTIVEGMGDGSSFTADLTGLTTFTQYTYRAFIVYDDNTVYGDEQNFWTLMAAPMVTTGSATNITENSATLNATINSNLEDVNLYIFEYKPSGSTHYSWVPGTGNGNSFSAELTGLTAGTEYTYHALISTYDAQVSYGDEMTFTTTTSTPATFTCGDNLTVGSYSYTTNQYGSQCWMTQNLRSTNGNYRFEYPDVESSCPNGWRLPDNGDWGALGNVLPSSSVAFGDGDFWTTSYMPWQDGQGNQYTLIASPYVQSNTVFSSPGIACEVHDAAHGDCWGTISQIYIRCLRDETGGATVTTGNATSVMENTATLNASITNPDNVTITSKGFEYKVSGGTYTTVEGTGDGSSFTADLTGLAAYTQYTYRAFIVYNNNTIYGDEMTFSTTASTPATFTCGDNLTVGSYSYTTNQYGSQCWMTENLRNTTGGYQFDYPDVLSACPTGWHMPNNDEWGALGGNLPSSSVIFGDGSYWTTNNIPYQDADGNQFTLIAPLSVQSNSYLGDQGVACEVHDAAQCDCSPYGGSCVYVRCVRDETGSTTQAPTVTTGNATDLAEHAATLNATITNPDNVTVTAMGFEYRASGGNDYTTTYTTVYGTGNGSSFTADLTGLTTFTQYTYRAFIVYDDNTVYGDEQTFWSLMAVPTVTTGSATNITENSATLNATVSNPDMVNYFTFEYKPISSTHYSWVYGTGNGNSFSAELTGLTAGTEYTYHAFISTYDAQVSYGDEMTFTTAAATPATIITVPCDPTAAHPAQTSSDFQGNGYNGANHGLETVTSDGKINSVTDYDGNEYPVVQIGSQCWLAENLRCTHSPSTGTYLVNNQFISGEQIAYTYTGKMARWCNNDSLTNAPQHYGLLYNWNAAVDVYNTSFEELSINTNSSYAVGQTFTGNRQGICPNGWHIPNDAEWNALEAEICGSDWQTDYETAQGYRGMHAGELVTGQWISGGITQNTTDAYPGNLTYINRNNSGFAALPAGSASDYFDCYDDFTYFWSSQQENYNSKKAWTRFLNSSIASVGRFSEFKYGGRSVRCIRDSE
jgi:uncharacterized protein (TIGR02145 family)